MTSENRPGRHKPWLIAIMALSLMLVALPGLANLPGSTFDAGDGNLVLDDEAQDWVNAPNRQIGVDRPTGATDDSFGQGTKEDSAVPTEVDGSIPNNKSDLLRFYVANEQANGDEFLYLAWERVQEPNGTTNMDFEFNQSTQLSANGVTPVRTAGDVLIKYDLSRGGTSPTLGYHLWVTSGAPQQVCEAANSVPCWGKVQSLAGNFEGAINTGPVTDPIPPDAPRTLSARTFGEAAINLTDSGILPAGACSGFGRAYLKSRSSDAFTSELKDFIRPIPVNIANCGRIIIRKETDPNGAAGTFSYTTTGGNATDGLPSSFSLQDGGSLDSGVTLQAGNYSVTEGDPTPAFDLTSISCTASTGSSFTTDTTARTASISLAANGLVDCTFNNRQRGTIIIRKQTDPNGAAGTFGYTTTGALDPATFNLADDGVRTYSNLLPGAYSVTENDPSPFDLSNLACTATTGSSATTSLATRTASITLGAGGTVDCTFTNRARGTISIHKEDDAGNPLQGAVFTLFTDNAPLNGSPPHGAEDTATSKTCTTGADGNCTISDIAPGQYWVVETTGVPGHDLAADQNVVIGAGSSLSLTFVDPRQHTVIVLVCHEGTNTLAASDVTNGTSSATTLSSPPGGITEAQLCALGGARFTGKSHGTKTLTVDVGSDAH